MKISNLLRAAYEVEADILQATDFPPLKRSTENIQNAKAIFFGCIEDGILVGVCEVELNEHKVNHIASLGVLPIWFRKGIGSGLIKHVLRNLSGNEFTVNTGEKNIPAITLYEKLGFSICNSFETPDGIQMVRLRKINS